MTSVDSGAAILTIRSVIMIKLMSAMGYIILKLAGSHSLGDPRNLEDVMYLLFIRTNVISLLQGLLVGGLCLIHNNTHTVMGDIVVLNLNVTDSHHEVTRSV